MRNVEQNGQLYFWNDLVTKERSEDSFSVYNIPSDSGNRFTLSLSTHDGAFGDVWITMHDSSPGDERWIYFRSLRLRGAIGGGFNPFITGQWEILKL